MSKIDLKKSRVRVNDLLRAKEAKQKISMMTCYDFSFAKIIDQTSIDVVLVGDSLGNVMLGLENTLPVTLEHMIHHSAAVSRGLTRAFLCGDMPFMSYQISPAQALESAGRLVKEGFCHGVKLEGGREIAAQVRSIVGAGIPVMGHLGLTPQSVHALSGYKVQGRSAEARRSLVENAKILEDSGAFSVVLELVPADLAAEVTAALSIPTIGIGAGPSCDGQVLVLHDMLGFSNDFSPKFLKKYADIERIAREALQSYDNEVKSSVFPDAQHSFS